MSTQIAWHKVSAQEILVNIIGGVCNATLIITLMRSVVLYTPCLRRETCDPEVVIVLPGVAWLAGDKSTQAPAPALSF